MKKRLLFIIACLFLWTGMAIAQVSRVTGTVIAADDNEPIAGASIHVKGTKVNAITDVDGNFVLTHVPADAKTLVISYVGMATQEVAVAPVVNVVLHSDTEMLDELVVQVAYGSAKKSSITGAISQVNKEKIEMRPVTSVASALEGSTSGVQIGSSFGQPGNDPSIRIRGIGTVNGSSSPLYVIDGVPFGGNISDLNPADIESVSVLKDAASCALYGNRASNGVILITTKRGDSEKMQMELRINQGSYTRGVKEYKTTNAYQYMEAWWQNMKNARMSAGDDAATAAQYATDNLISESLYLNIFNKADNEVVGTDGKITSGTKILDGYAEDLDWFDQATRSGYRQEYVVSGNARGDRSDFYFSLGYLDEQGYALNSTFNRLSGRTSVNINPVKWLKAGVNLSGTHQKSNAANGNGDGSASYTNVFMYARNIAPIYPVHLHNADGSYLLDADGNKQYDSGQYTDANGQTYSTRNQYVDRHVIWENELNMDKSFRNTLQGVAYADIKFLNDFTFSLKGDLNVRNNENQTYNSAVIGDGKGNGGRASRTRYRYKNYTAQEILNWAHTFNGIHEVSAMLAHENYYYNYSYEYGYKTTEVFANKTNLSNFTEITSLTGYDGNYRTESYLGRVRYGYDQKYNVEASFRRDGSSRFAKGHRWGSFGSIGANWVVSKENFMKDIHWVNSLKLRANWGQVGNDAGAGYYGYMALYTASQNNHLGAYYQSQAQNLDLKWETGESWGIGLETRLFNRWNVELEYFDKRNKDLIFDVYMPLSAGSNNISSANGTITQNIGTISNRGVEINTDVDIFRNRDWKVNFSTSASFIKNKVKKLPDQNKDGIISGIYKIVEGKSRYEFYTYTFEGVDQLTGNSVYKPNFEDYYITLEDGSTLGNTEEGTDITAQVTEINGKYYVNNTTYAQKEWHGSALPKVYGSFGLNVSWKQLALSTLFTYQLGGKLYDGVYADLMYASTSVSNLHSDIMKSWNGVPEGITETSANRIDPNGIPQINSTLTSNNNATSSRFLTSSDYLVFKNINLSYTLPKHWVRSIGLQNVGLNVTCENLFTITARRGLNPQQSFSGSQGNYLVTPRVFSVGLNVKL